MARRPGWLIAFIAAILVGVGFAYLTTPKKYFYLDWWSRQRVLGVPVNQWPEDLAFLSSQGFRLMNQETATDTEDPIEARVVFVRARFEYEIPRWWPTPAVIRDVQNVRRERLSPLNDYGVIDAYTISNIDRIRRGLTPNPFGRQWLAEMKDKKLADHFILHGTTNGYSARVKLNSMAEKRER